jgi:hypothetical protein
MGNLEKKGLELLEKKSFRSPIKLKKSFSSKFLLVSLKDFFYLFIFLLYRTFHHNKYHFMFYLHAPNLARGNGAEK